MHVRVKFGPRAGSVIDYPYHVGIALVEAGRGERVDPSAADVEPPTGRAFATVPAIETRDPKIETTPARNRKARRRR